MKRKKLIIIISSLAVVLLVVGIVFAYLTARSNIENNITIGKNEIEVSEDFVPPVLQTTDTRYKKQISVVNTGNVDCYIRVYADFSDETIRANSYFSNDTTAENAASAENYYSAKRDTSDKDAYINHLPDGWVFVPDDSSKTKLAGYYYYTKPVSPEKSTENPLFTYVKTTYDKLDDVKQYDIIVYAESVQTTDSNGNAYSDYESAWNDFLK